MMRKGVCVNCKCNTNSILEEWLEKCPVCNLWRAHLTGRFNEEKDDLSELRDVGFKDLRQSNFRTILEILSKAAVLKDQSIIDIGCANGWFIEEAQKLGMKAFGVEPEMAIARLGLERGLPIRVGFFPQVLDPDERFDNIVFNDFFEHLPDPEMMLQKCHSHLNEEGHLVLNLPNSEGFFYRLSLILANLGFKKSLHRLWQVDFYTPHLFYFSLKNLSEIAHRNGFRSISNSRLHTVKVSGLWKRLNIPGAPISIFKRSVIFLLVAMSAPLINYLFPADTFVLILKKI